MVRPTRTGVKWRRAERRVRNERNGRAEQLTGIDLAANKVPIAIC